jgi:Family of unknown function (DUF6291)
MRKKNYPMSKKSFYLYKDSLQILDDLSDEQVAGLFRAIKDFQLGEEKELDPLVKLVFLPFRNQFLRDEQKYSEICAIRSESGSKGGAAKASKSYQKLASGSKSKQDLANLADKDKDKEKDKEKDKDKEIIDSVAPFSSERFKNLWAQLLKTKKWRKKEQSSIGMALKKLGGYSEPIACKMIENAIVGEWQGLFPLKDFEIKAIESAPTTQTNGRKPVGVKVEFGWLMFDNGTNIVLPQNEILAIHQDPSLLSKYQGR